MIHIRVDRFLNAGELEGRPIRVSITLLPSKIQHISENTIDFYKPVNPLVMSFPINDITEESFMLALEQEHKVLAHVYLPLSAFSIHYYCRSKFEMTIVSGLTVAPTIQLTVHLASIDQPPFVCHRRKINSLNLNNFNKSVYPRLVSGQQPILLTGSEFSPQTHTLASVLLTHINEKYWPMFLQPDFVDYLQKYAPDEEEEDEYSDYYSSSSESSDDFHTNQSSDFYSDEDEMRDYENLDDSYSDVFTARNHSRKENKTDDAESTDKENQNPNADISKAFPLDPPPPNNQPVIPIIPPARFITTNYIFPEESENIYKKLKVLKEVMMTKPKGHPRSNSFREKP